MSTQILQEALREKKFPDPSIKASISRIVKLSAKDPSPIDIGLLTTATSRKWVDNNNYVVSLESNNGYKLDGWTLGNQLYMPLFLQINNLLNYLTHSI